MNNNTKTNILVGICFIGIFILIILIGILIGSKSMTPFTYDVNSDERLQFCYHKSPCTTFIYLEQQVGCYQGCKFYTVQDNNIEGEYGDNYLICTDACDKLYQDKWREYN